MDLVVMSDVTCLDELLGMVVIFAFRTDTPDATSCIAATTSTVLRSFWVCL